jgi:hypothetical protein
LRLLLGSGTLHAQGVHWYPLLGDHLNWLSAYFESNAFRTLFSNVTHRVLPALVSFPASVGVPRYRSSLWQSRSSWCACDRGTREARELRIGSDSRGKDDEQGNFILDDVEPGEYQLRAEEPTFVSAISDVSVYGGQKKQVTLQLRQLVSVSQSITVVASATSLLTPDPAQSIVIHDQVLDANPGRPGAPISIPGYWKNGAENVITMVKWSSVSDSIT